MATKAKRSTRWSIGLFRNGAGKLVAAYVTADGKPMPYEQKRVGRKKSLHNGIYRDMKYSEARQHLLKDAAKVGLKDGATKKPKATASKAKKAKKSLSRKRTAKK